MTHDSLTQEIIEEIGEREGADPTELPPLHNYIDTEAIEALRGDAQIIFHYHKHVVSIEMDGSVRIFNSNQVEQ